VALAYAGLLALLLVAAPTFYEGDEFRSILVKSAPILIAAVGMTLVILARQIDISIGSLFSVCGIAAGLLARAGVPMTLVIPLTLIVGAAMGALNGLLVAGAGLPAIVVTLAMRVVLRESLRWLREGEFVRGLPDRFQWFGLGQTAGRWLLIGSAATVFVLFLWALRFLAAGRSVRAVGSESSSGSSS